MSNLDRRQRRLGHPGGAQPVQHPSLGREVLRHQRRRARRRQAAAGRRRVGGPDRRDRGGQGARAEVSAADPVPGHPAPPRRVDQPGLPQFHRRVQLPGQVPRRVPDQGEPAARGGGGNSRCGQAVRFRPGSRQQAGVVRRAGAAKPDRQPDHLQRLQGRQLHPHGAARHQAGQEGHHGRREARGTAPDHHRLQAARRRTAHRHPRAAAEQGRRPMGRERRRERQVRSEHGGDCWRRRKC